MQIYLARNNQQAGPYSLEQLNQMLASQQVLLTDLVWHQGMQEWKALGELTQGKMEYQPENYVAPTPSPFPSSTPVSENYQNPSIQKVSVEKKQTELASLGSRFLAKIIDLALWIPISYILTAFFTAEQEAKFIQLNQQLYDVLLNASSNAQMGKEIQNQIFQMIPSQAIMAAVAYILIMLGIQAFLIAKSGQSIGKKVTKIKIVDAETGQKVSLLRGFTIRSVIFIVLNLMLAPFISIIDFLFVLGIKKQTLHDKLAKTQVKKQ